LPAGVIKLRPRFTASMTGKLSGATRWPDGTYTGVIARILPDKVSVPRVMDAFEIVLNPLGGPRPYEVGRFLETSRPRMGGS